LALLGLYLQAENGFVARAERRCNISVQKTPRPQTSAV